MPALPLSLVRWRAVPANEIHFAQWGDDVVLFHQTSGLTHLVNVATVVLLREILADPQTFDAAARALVIAQRAQADEHFLSGLAELVQRLEALGLVERVAA